MLASLPQLADKNFVIGYLLPVLLGGLAAVFLFRDFEAVQTVYSAVFEEKTLSDLALVAVGVWTASLILLLLNYYIYRFVEGYFGPFNRAAWSAIRRAEHDDETRYLNQISGNPALRGTYLFRSYEFQNRWPVDRNSLLPTRFGNAIRSFEAYPYDTYRIDSISSWYRLQALVPKEFLATIRDARVQVDFFLNALVLASLIGLAAMIRLLVNVELTAFCSRDDAAAAMYCITHGLGRFRWEFLVWMLAAFALARLCYLAAVGQAIAWGGFVKSAFDLYLPKLAEQLGYVLPETNAERTEFWGDVSWLFLYRERIPDKWPRAKPAEEDAEAAPGNPDDFDDSGD